MMLLAFCNLRGRAHTGTVARGVASRDRPKAAEHASGGVQVVDRGAIWRTIFSNRLEPSRRPLRAFVPERLNRGRIRRSRWRFGFARRQAERSLHRCLRGPTELQRADAAARSDRPRRAWGHGTSTRRQRHSTHAQRRRSARSQNRNCESHAWPAATRVQPPAIPKSFHNAKLSRPAPHNLFGKNRVDTRAIHHWCMVGA